MLTKQITRAGSPSSPTITAELTHHRPQAHAKHATLQTILALAVCTLPYVDLPTAATLGVLTSKPVPGDPNADPVTRDLLVSL